MKRKSSREVQNPPCSDCGNEMRFLNNGLKCKDWMYSLKDWDSDKVHNYQCDYCGALDFVIPTH